MATRPQTASVDHCRISIIPGSPKSCRFVLGHVPGGGGPCPRVWSRSPAKRGQLAVGHAVQRGLPGTGGPAGLRLRDESGGHQAAGGADAGSQGGGDSQFRGEPVGGQLRRIVLGGDPGGGRDAVPQFAVVDCLHPVLDGRGMRRRAQGVRLGFRLLAPGGLFPGRPAWGWPPGSATDRSRTARRRSGVEIWLTSSGLVGWSCGPASWLKGVKAGQGRHRIDVVGAADAHHRCTGHFAPYQLLGQGAPLDAGGPADVRGAHVGGDTVQPALERLGRNGHIGSLLNG